MFFHSENIDNFVRSMRVANPFQGFSPSYMDASFIYASGSMETTITRLPTRVQCLYCTVVNTDNDKGLCHACGAPLPDERGQVTPWPAPMLHAEVSR